MVRDMMMSGLLFCYVETKTLQEICRRPRLFCKPPSTIKSIVVKKHDRNSSAEFTESI